MTFDAWEASPPPPDPPNPTTTRYIAPPLSQTPKPPHPSHIPTPPPPPKPTNPSSPVHPNPHFPSYNPPVLATLSATSRLPQTHFAHLACSLLARPTAPAPSLVQLKQHAQALCLLISLLQPQIISNDGDGGPFDFLEDLEEPYENNAEAQNQPLESLRDTVASARHNVSEISNVPTALACPILHASDTGEIIEHANTLLTRLDDIYTPSGGILSILPPSSSPNTTNPRNPNHPLFPPTNPNHPSNLAPHTLLHQLLTHALTLPRRLAAHERELASLRQLLAGEACVPAVRLSQQLQFGTSASTAVGGGGGPGVRELVAGQDRYVLAGLSTALWERLGDEFRVAEGYGAATRKYGFDAAEISDDLFSTENDDDDDDGGDGGDNGAGVTWIECTSRLYRLNSHPETVFVIPAWDVLPGAEAVRRIEEGVLVGRRRL